MSRAGAAVATGLVARTRAVDVASAPGLLDHLGDDGFAWLHRGTGYVTSGVAARIALPTGAGRTIEAARAVSELLGAVEHDGALGRPATGPLAIGAVPFDDATPGELVVPARIVGLDAEGGWITEVGPAPAPAPVAPPVLSPIVPISPIPPTRAHRFDVRARSDRRDWDAAVTRALSAIATGRLEKVVLAREVSVTSGSDFDRRSIVERLRADQPSSFVFAAGSWVGATPELLVRRSGTLAVSRPMAGTAPTEQAQRLARSAKEANEHRVVVDAVVAALEPFARRVRAPKRPTVEHVPGMAHLVTTIEAALADPVPSALELAGRLHPTPAVAGTPRAAAVELIGEVEGFDRGCYAGPVGWVDAHGDGEWAVALRCAEIDGPRARLLAGAGIVEGSDPAAEWAETQAKFAPMLSALVRP